MTSRWLKISRKTFCSLIIFGVIYCNLRVIFSAFLRYVPPPIRPPFTETLHDLFAIFGIFSDIDEFNRDMDILGLEKGSSSETTGPRWILLDAAHFVPGDFGERLRRIWLSKYDDVLGKEAQKDGWAFLARKVRERYNREHPDQPIEKVMIVNFWWPRSKDGYRINYEPDKLNQATLFVES